MDFLKEAARDAPHFPALKTCEGTFSFQELELETQKIEASLYLHPGEIVAAQLPPGRLFIALLFATLRLGGLFCPINPRFSLPLERLNPKLFFSNQGCEIFSGVTSPHRSQVLLFTSGTTAEPKIACLPQQSLEASARSAVSRLDLKPQDEWLLSLPLHHVGGLGIVFRCLHAKATMALAGCEQKVTHMSAVPTQLYRAWPTAKTLRCLLLGGAPILNVPQELPIICSYGMTETASLVLADGQVLPEKEVKLVNGEIWVRGDSMFEGYLGEAKRNPLDWFPTKDLGAFDDAKGFVITGRKDNQFICGGENIQPEEIEKTLLQHPDILEALVVPKQDPEYGARPVAFLQSVKKLPELRSIQQFLAGKLPKYKIPIAVDLLLENEFKRERKKYIEKAQKISIF
ncbi:MAG TPA: AMP-binding protein [Chlamydiales bacterium]|jgi:O-succinylbenzoic acid--CoA ligase